MEKNITDKPESGKKYSLLSLARSGLWAASEVEDVSETATQEEITALRLSLLERERQAKAAKKLKEVDTIAVELRKQYPWAKDDGKRGHVKAAKSLKKELALAFPSVKFSVRSESFAGGNAVRIEWTDGPTGEEVDTIANKYSDGDFDGMIDCYEYDHSAYGDAVLSSSRSI